MGLAATLLAVTLAHFPPGQVAPPVPPAPAVAVVATKPVLRDAIPIPTALAPETPPKAVDPQRLTPGKFRLLKIDNYAGAVTWKIGPPAKAAEQTLDAATAPPDDVAVVFTKFRKDKDPAAKPKDVRVRGALEGEAAARWHAVPADAGDALYLEARPGKAARVLVAAWGVKDGEAVELVAIEITVGDPPPAPDTPDVPAGPDAPAAPAAGVAGKFQKAALDDLANQRAAKAEVKALGEVYAAGSTIVERTDPASSPPKTVEDVVKRLNQESDKQKLAEYPRLKAVRDAARDDFLALAGSNGQRALTADDRTKMAKFFAGVAAGLAAASK